MLEIDIKDVYFLMGLSRRGDPIILFIHWTMPQQTNEYIAQFYVLGSHEESGRIVIKYVRDLPLRAIIFTITKLEEALVLFLLPNHIWCILFSVLILGSLTGV
jgi:hypothetical protein